MDKELTIDMVREIIERETLIVESLKTQLPFADCKSCVQESIEYHETFVWYFRDILLPVMELKEKIYDK